MGKFFLIGGTGQKSAALGIFEMRGDKWAPEEIADSAYIVSGMKVAGSEDVEGGIRITREYYEKNPVVYGVFDTLDKAKDKGFEILIKNLEDVLKKKKRKRETEAAAADALLLDYKSLGLTVDEINAAKALLELAAGEGGAAGGGAAGGESRRKKKKI